MFDVGFWELALVGVVALLVVGPDKLPGLARTVGLYVGKIRRTVAQVKADIEREVRAEELRKSVEEARALRDAYESLEETRKDLSGAVSSLETAHSALQDTEASASKGGEESQMEAGPEEGRLVPSGTGEGRRVGREVRGVTVSQEAAAPRGGQAASEGSTSRGEGVKAEAGERRSDA